MIIFDIFIKLHRDTAVPIKVHCDIVYSSNRVHLDIAVYRFNYCRDGSTYRMVSDDTLLMHLYTRDLNFQNGVSRKKLNTTWSWHVVIMT